MTGTDNICRKIIDDAQRAADLTCKLAEERAALLLDEAEKKGQNEYDAMVEQAVAHSFEMQRRQSAVARLEGRKSLLAAKQSLLDQAFDQALDRLCALPADQCRDLMRRLALQAAQGGETLCPAPAHASLVDGAFYDTLNAALAQKGVQPVAAGPVREGLRGGFVLQKGGLEINCSFETLIRLSRDTLTGEVAGMLFSDC